MGKHAPVIGSQQAPGQGLSGVQVPAIQVPGAAQSCLVVLVQTPALQQAPTHCSDSAHTPPKYVPPSASQSFLSLTLQELVAASQQAPAHVSAKHPPPANRPPVAVHTFTG